MGAGKDNANNFDAADYHAAVRGGQFAAWEQPQLAAVETWAAFRWLRGLEDAVKPRGAALNGSVGGTAELRLVELGIELPPPPEPFGVYAEAVQTGNLLFLTGMLPIENQAAAFVGRVGELDVEHGRKAARLAARNALSVARQHLGSLDRVTRVVRLGVAVATAGDMRDHAKVADGASELLQDVFGRERNPTRLVYGVASLPLGASVELEVIFEVSR